MDFPGIAIFVSATVNLLVVLNLGGEKLPWDHPIIISLIISSLLLGIAFILTEKFLAKRPLIPLWLLRTNGVGISCLVQVLIFLAKASTFSNIAPYFIRTQNASNATAANYLLLPYIIYALAALAAGHIISRTSRYKMLSVASAAISILAHLLITVRWRHGTNIWEAQYVDLIGVGFGMLLSTTFIGLSASAPKPQLATAIGMYYLSQQFGEILGVSISATILRGDFRNTLQKRLGDQPDAERIVDGAVNDTGFAATLPKAIQSIVRSSYLHCFQFAPLLSTCTYALALALIVYLSEYPLK
jgi:MFS family permease